MTIYPVIMCGGSGVRLWPASRPSRPKQFIRLIGERSIFQQTVLRVAGIAGAQAPLIVAGLGHAEAIRDQLAEIGVEAHLLLEPEARDSAPAMAAAAAWVAVRDPGAVMVVVASDHHIPDDDAFRAAAETAAQAAGGGQIVTLGVRPTAPSTAYGYIRAGEASGPVKPVAAFVEKPEAQVAAAHVAAGFLWNSGNFIVRADRLLSELAEHAPDVRRSAEIAVAEAGEASELGPAFRGAPKISIDYAVMEKTRHAAVLPVDFHWSDVGAWDAVLPALPRDGRGNAVSGAVRLHDVDNALVRNDGGPMVVAVGVRDVAIIVEADAILVCGLDSAQSVKAATEALKAEGAAVADLPREESLGEIAERLDRWLNVQALPLWQAIGVDHAGGGFFEAIDQDGRPAIGPRRMRVQPRQAFVYASAGEAGWAGPWRAAMDAGLDNLERRYRRPDGLFRTLVGADGAPLSETAMTYDQAFALLAWSEAGREAQALALLDALDGRRHSAGGFVEEGDQPYLSNPHMHLFEAALAWIESGGDARWRSLAEEIVGLALGRLIDADGGFVREYFDADWRPATGEPGRRVEPGHQFEWAWLLARWAVLSGDGAARTAADRLYRAGLKGIDRARGVAVDALHDDFSVLDGRARLWPQTEWLKASVALDRPDQALCAARAVAGYLKTPLAGLWRDRMDAAGAYADELAPASSLYHLYCAIAELKAYVSR